MLPTSIIRRTLLFVLLLLITMASIIGIISFKDARHEIEEIFDARLAQNARILQAIVLGIHESDLSSAQEKQLQLAFEEALLTEADANNGGHKYESKIAYQVWHGKQLILRSPNSPETPIGLETVGFSNIRLEGYQWTTFTLKTHSSSFPFIVSVAEREDVRGELVEKIVLQTLIPELIGIPILALLLWKAISWGLYPLRELTNLIKGRAPDNLKPIQLKAPPTELKPIQDALNRLLIETETLISREQRLIADAAHELRTPLAVLKIHTDNALMAQTDSDRKNSLHQLDLAVDRSTRVVSQLLTLARLDPDLKPDTKTSIDLLQQTRQNLAELMPIAWEKQIELSLEADEALSWQAEIEDGMLDVLLQNLISNAVKFSPSKSSIELHLEKTAGSFQLTVVDHGSGVDSDDLERITERFYRSGNESGAGLGLSIVKRITQRHNGRLELKQTPGGGLTVQVNLPK